jgi:hypothetical protein
MNSFTPQAGALEEHYKRMAAGWREKCVELQEENALLRKRAPSAPGLYQATVDASGVLVVGGRRDVGCRRIAILGGGERGRSKR